MHSHQPGRCQAPLQGGITGAVHGGGHPVSVQPVLWLPEEPGPGVGPLLRVSHVSFGFMTHF